MAKKKKSYAEWMKENYGITNDYVERVNSLKTSKDDEDIAPVKTSNKDIAPVKETQTSKTNDWSSIYKEAVRLQTEAENLRVGLNSKKGKAYYTQKANADSATEKLNTYLKQYGFTNIDELKSAAYGKDERTWFKSSEYFDDGYDFGDVTKTIIGSIGDIDTHLVEGFTGVGEKLVDAGAMLGNVLSQQNMNQAAQDEMLYNFVSGKKDEDVLQRYQIIQDEVEKETAEFVKKDLYNEEEIGKILISDPLKTLTGVDTEKHSVIGEKSDSVAVSAGQLGAQMAVSAIPGVGQTGGMIMLGATTLGDEAENALNQGATFDEAMLSATISAGAEMLTEKIGGISFGGKTLTDAAFNKLSSKMTSKLATALVATGKVTVDALAEGNEGLLSGYISAIGQKLTYMEDKEIEELFSDDDKLESFIGDVVLGGIGGGTEAISQGKGYVTGLNKNEQAVVDRVYKDEVAEEEKGGKKLTAKEKSKIYDDVLNKLEKGDISTDTIEEVLGGETYKSYKDTLDKETSLQKQIDTLQDEYNTLNKMKLGEMTGEQTDRKTELKQELEKLKEQQKGFSTKDSLKSQLSEETFSLVKDSKLAESYNEKSRRGQAFQVDLSQYEEKYHTTLKNAVDSGILNNTNKTHEFVDLIAKISADKGVTFDFTDNEKLKASRFALDGKTVNGYITESGNVTLNINSAKALNSVVGHEVTHVLEGTEFYDVLAQSVTEFAKSKGEYDSRLKTLTELYNGVEGTNVEAELVADLVGDYVFTDADFVRKLSVENRNVFQKIYDEIKYLCKVATAGSKEARELEKVKKIFADVYRESNTAQKNTAENSGVRYSITEPFVDNNGVQYDNAVLLDTDFFDGLSPRNWGGKLRDYVYNRSENNPFIMTVVDEKGKAQQLQFANPEDRVSKEGGSNHKVIDKLSSSSDNVSKLAVIHIDEIAEISEENNPYYTNENNHQWLDKNGWLHRNTNVINRKNGNIYNLTFDIAKAEDGRIILYATDGKIKKVGNVQVNSLNIRGSGLNSNFKKSITKNGEKVNTEKSNDIAPVKKSLSQQGSESAQYGDYNVSGKDIMFEAPIREDIAKTEIKDDIGPVKDVVSKTEGAKTDLEKSVADYVESNIEEIESDLNNEALNRESKNIFAGTRKGYVRRLSNGTYESGTYGEGTGIALNENIIRTDSLEEAISAQYKYMLENSNGDISRTIQKHVTNYDNTHKAVEEDIAPVKEIPTNTEIADTENFVDSDEADRISSLLDIDSEEADRVASLLGSDMQPTNDNDITPLPTANVLTNSPKAKNKKSSIWSTIKTNLLDKGSVFETLSLKTKNRKLQAKYNFMHYSEARAQKLIGEGTKDVKSLNSIRETVEGLGLTKEFYSYMYHNHNIDRMSLKERYNTPNKAVFDDSVTAQMSKDEVAKYESNYPEFKTLAQDVYDYMDYLRKQLVDNNIITQETADKWAEMYPHYVPIQRATAIDDTEIDNAPRRNKKSSKINAPIKNATGGNSDILPLFDTMAQRTIQTYKATAKNNFGIELKNTISPISQSENTSLDEVIDSVDTHENLLQEGINGRSPTFTIFENGKRVTFKITEEMYDALKPTSEKMAYTNKVASGVSNTFRGLLTEYNPTFMLTNAIKDAQDVLLNSQHPARTYANFPTAIKELIGKGKWYAEYMENGGEQNTYFEKQSNTFAKEKSTLRKVVGFPLDAISTANNFIERIPRLAEYIVSRKSGASIEEAMLDSARVTTNFAAGGDVTKFLNRNGFTFLNASVQGAMQNVRNIREAKANGLKGWVGLATKVTLAGLPAMLLNSLVWDDDEEYAELSDYVKDNYYIVGKMNDGTFVRIPKGRASAVIQDAFEQISNAITGNDDVDFANFFDLVMTNIAPNNPIDNNIIAPIMQVKNNKTWYGDDLVPTRLQDLPDKEQFDESTDSISKWLGENLNYSPYKINYLLNQYSGGAGDIVLPMLTPKAESGNNSFMGNLIAPLKDKFTTDSVMNNQNISDFYDTVDELTKNANSSKATDEDILKNKYMNSINSELGELYGRKRDIQNDSTLNDKEKYSQVRDIQEQINTLAKDSLNSYKNVSIEGSYATVGDLHYRWYEPSETSESEPGWQKITGKQLEKQKKVTNGLGITASDYWSNKDEYDYAYENPEKYALAESVGGYKVFKSYSSDFYDIKADKDKDGNSISGSRKLKVIDYINGLDIDYGAKIILYKSQYKSDDTYNNDIIEYLNGRSDISYKQMETILTELGFKVLSDGTVQW